MDKNLNLCKPHNWLFDEFEEPCPLCEAIKTEQERILALLNAWVYDDNGDWDKMMLAIKGENK
jgi:hypothetical protein